MGERWVLIFVGNDEILRCNSCDTYLHNQKVHLYLDDVNDEIDEVMCDTCWKEKQKETFG
jgi:hypothetical protein